MRIYGFCQSFKRQIKRLNVDIYLSNEFFFGVKICIYLGIDFTIEY